MQINYISNPEKADTSLIQESCVQQIMVRRLHANAGMRLFEVTSVRLDGRSRQTAKMVQMD